MAQHEIEVLTEVDGGIESSEQVEILIEPTTEEEALICPDRSINLPDLRSEMRNTKIEMHAALLSMFFNANLTQSAFSTVVDFLNASYQADLPKNFDSIADKFLKELDVVVDFTKTYTCSYCNTCIDRLSTPKQRLCPVCNCRLTMNYYFNLDHQINRVLSKNVVQFEIAGRIDLNTHPDIIKDVTDGEIYRNFLKTNEGQKVLNGNGFTFSINTDGCNPSDKSNISLWPVFLTINEVKIGERYCPDNIIIAGSFFDIL